MQFSTTRKLTLITNENVRIQKRLKYKEQDGTQVLQIGVTMAKLWPLLNYCELFMKCVFCTKFL